MPQETDRLKLPLPLGNENVTRESINEIFEKIDAGVATRDEVEALRQMMGEMDIPDASLTVAGKVQLSNKIDGDSEELAVTEKALNDARVAAQKYTDDNAFKLSAAGAGLNLNTMRTTGFYTINGPTNGPTMEGSNIAILEVFAYSASYVLQRLTVLSSPIQQVYERTSINSTGWYSWEKVGKYSIWGAL